jgi:hypothetical protein
MIKNSNISEIKSRIDSGGTFYLTKNNILIIDNIIINNSYSYQGGGILKSLMLNQILLKNV